MYAVRFSRRKWIQPLQSRPRGFVTLLILADSYLYYTYLDYNNYNYILVTECLVCFFGKADRYNRLRLAQNLHYS